MSEVKIRQLPDWVVKAHKQQAQRMGKSLEQHLRTVITESARDQKSLLLQIARVCRENLEQEIGQKLPDRTADIIREMRDERG